MGITIKAAFVDVISRLVFRRKELANLPNKVKTIERNLNKLSKDDLINILNISESYYFEDESIIYTRALSELEREDFEFCINKGIEYDISRLKTWCDNSKENKEQILNYISLHNIEIKEI